MSRSVTLVVLAPFNPYKSNNRAMTTKVRMIIMSHLSDLQEDTGPNPTLYRNTKINFVKWLILMYPNTSTKVDADKVWDAFCSRHKKETV